MNVTSARVIADSYSTNTNQRMITLEIEYPRFILAELNTHRMLSKNSASSRAIPIASMHQHILENTATPVHWGRNQPGMQAETEVPPDAQTSALKLWNAARDSALQYSTALAGLGLHKQIANRVTEPWMTMKTVISGTEWANLLWLRDHPDAQPEFADLAAKIRLAVNSSTPQPVAPGEWHVPYVTTYRDDAGVLCYESGTKITAQEACIVSASCCAQVSYRKTDDSLEKAKKIYQQLIESEPAHASPVEHQATPMDLNSYDNYDPETWEQGVTHVSANGSLWSGNLQGWIQHRKLIFGEARWGDPFNTYQEVRGEYL